MKLPRRLVGTLAATFVHNVAARLLALLSLAAATVIVARLDGAAGVGAYALLRVLPGLAGVVASAGLPGACAFFLAGPRRDDPGNRSTIAAMAVLGGVLGSLLWLVATPLLQVHLLSSLSPDLVAWAGAAVCTQLLVATAKNCALGFGDMGGSNAVIVLEELTFLPWYIGLLAVDVSPPAALVAALVLSDVTTAAYGWGRLRGRRFFDGMGSPSRDVALQVASYGWRGQVGGLLSLLNLRLDFLLLSAMAGPATLGTYAIASKYAELLRVPARALTYVLYPKFATAGPRAAGRRVRSLLPRTALLSALGAIPLALVTAPVIVLLYGREFVDAVLPAYILLAGLVGESVGAVVTAYLYGVGRPGLNSAATAAGLVLTAVLDVLLIPRWQAVGAAIASGVAYLGTTIALLLLFRALARRAEASAAVADRASGAEVLQG